MQLRDYQQAAVEKVFDEWREHSSTLVVCPTGTGKTQIFCDVIRRVQPGRTLVLAHRSELITQAVNRLWSFDIEASIEMADQYANESEWERAPVVVSTIQTQCAGRRGRGRMTAFDPYDFQLVVCDEAHHYVAPSFKRVVDYYRQNSSLKVLGVTATPDRADEYALGQVFESVAYDYEILDAINDGWLVSVEQQMVNIEGLDFSHVRTTAGDLNGADLAAVMEAEKNLHGIASSAIEIIGNRRTLCFTVTVRQAERLSEIFNRHRPEMANWICAQTPKDERFRIFNDFSSGRTQVLVNVGIATEGYDNPGVEVVVQARPTKSRCLYAQMIGRALRPLTGCVDHWEEAEDRKIAIGESAKPAALILDFVGNSGKHKLMTTADILGGKVSDEAIERVIEEAKKSGRPVDMARELEEAEARLRREAEERRQRETARRANVTAKARFSVHTVNPFNILHLAPVRERGWDQGKTLSERQREFLLKQAIDPTGMSYAEGKQLIDQMIGRWKNNLATIKQVALLQKHGYADAHTYSFEKASRLINELANNGWKRVA